MDNGLKRYLQVNSGLKIIKAIGAQMKSKNVIFYFWYEF